MPTSTEIVAYDKAPRPTNRAGTCRADRDLDFVIRLPRKSGQWGCRNLRWPRLIGGPAVFVGSLGRVDVQLFHERLQGI